MKSFKSRDKYEAADFTRWGQVLIWCANEVAPSPQKREVFCGISVVKRCEQVLFDGVLCDARYVEVAFDVSKKETRFLAVRVKP